VPGSFKDWYYPRTGRKNPDGSEERVQPASYLRDVRDVSTAPWQTLKNKANPGAALLFDMLNNRDFFGDQIRNPDDPAVTQLAQEARYILGQAMPLGVRNVQEGVKRGQSLATSTQSLLGITPAPKAVVRSAAMNRMRDILATRGGSGGRTPEQRDQSAQRTDLMGRLRQHEPNAPKALGEAVARGEMSPAAAQRNAKASAMPGSADQFRHLTLPEALEVYRLATPEERRTLGPVLSDKLNRARPGQYSGKDLERIRRGLQAVQKQ
jgi:hypothetical protein